MLEIQPDKGPRIYNLFPRLVGTIDQWPKHVQRAKEMGFDWIYVNPLNFTGFSGSLYAIKDFYKFNPLFAPPGSDDPTSWAPLVEFIEYCHENDIKFMYDLVINHTSIDSVLIDTHPDWYVRKFAIINRRTGQVVGFREKDNPPTSDEFPPDRYIIEERIANPYAIDPADARNITIWGDLAELDDEHSPDLQSMINYWKDLVVFYLDMKMDGFRCDAAYQVPKSTWEQIISHARSKNKNVLFAAETLGCTIDQVEEVVDAGFDFIYNSSKWWDFSAPWCLEQYERFRKKAPSISFPESHDTERLAKETGKNLEYQVFRYFFAAFFSRGVMMPIGYEYGFTRKLDVVKGSPADWEVPAFDISSYIKHINNFKKHFKALNEEGPVKDFHYGNPAILVLRKTSNDGSQHLLLVYNKDWERSQDVPLDDLSYFLDLDAPVYKVNLFLEGTPIEGNSWRRRLEPNEFVIFYQDLFPKPLR